MFYYVLIIIWFYHELGLIELLLICVLIERVTTSFLQYYFSDNKLWSVIISYIIKIMFSQTDDAKL